MSHGTLGGFLKRLHQYFEQIEFILFRLTLLIVFVIALIRFLRGELHW